MKTSCVFLCVLCVISCPSGQVGFVHSAVSAFFYREEHEAGAKSTKIYTQFTQGLYIRIVIYNFNPACLPGVRNEFFLSNADILVPQSGIVFYKTLHHFNTLSIIHNNNIHSIFL